jgi:hypothetical protein
MLVRKVWIPSLRSRMTLVKVGGARDSIATAWLQNDSGHDMVGQGFA